jgi:serine/threonine protein phosphatase PrpC
MAFSATSKENKEGGIGKGELLDGFESFVREHHEGRPPERGLLEVGRTTTKEISDDAKLKNNQKGISLVADGISFSKTKTKEVGWFASNRTAELLYEDLGEKLDKEIENILMAALRKGENPLFVLTDYIQERIESSILAADQQIHTETQSIPEVHGSATTLSFTKLVELPDGKGGFVQRLFFANVGDSRVAILRDGERLLRLTDDDNKLQKYLEQGSITDQEWSLIDQAEHPSELPEHLRRYVNTKFAQQLTNKIGHGDAHTDVRYVDVKPGDRYIEYTDGLGQLTEKEIEALLIGEKDDNRAEGILQQKAMEMSLHGQSFRSDADDIAVSVQTVTERGPSRDYLKPEIQEERTVVDLNKRAQDSVKKAIAWRRQKTLVLSRIKELGHLPDRDVLLPELLALETAIKYEALFEAHAEQAELDIFERRMPHKFTVGMSVEMWRDDIDPPGRDTKPWAVTSYNPSTRMYTVRSGSERSVQVSRYKLESWQRVIPSPGDVMPIHGQEGDWSVISFGSDGRLVYAKEIGPELFRYEKIPISDANDDAKYELFLAEKRRVRLQAAARFYVEAKNKEQEHKAALQKREQEHKDELHLINLISLKKKAEDKAQ